MNAIDIPQQNQYTPKSDLNLQAAAGFNQQAGEGFNQQAFMNTENSETPHQVVNVKENANMKIIYPVVNLKIRDAGGARPTFTSSRLVDASFTSRVGFIRKVYTLLVIQLLITTGVCILSLLTTHEGGFGHFQYTNMWLLWTSLGVHVFLIILIFCFRKLARTVPWNYFLLFFFTLVEAYLISAICAAYSRDGQTSWVIISAGMTAGVTVSVTLYAMTTKTDFTSKSWRGLVCACPFIILLLCLSIWTFKFSILSSISNAIFAVIYCLFLIFDTQMVAGGKRHQLNMDDYVLGVVILYVDIVGLFLSILGSSGNKRN